MRYDVEFTKAVASGNDFIVLDDRNGDLSARKPDYPAMARDLCRRHLSVGADGILVLESTSKAVFRMRVMNPDGSEAEMCGNGARAASLYAFLEGWVSGGKEVNFETAAGILRAEMRGSRIKVRMSDPKDIKLGMRLGVSGRVMNVHFLNTGVPHVVCAVDGLGDYPVRDIGGRIRRHEAFAPAGTNVDFVARKDPGTFAMRTYERGVEDETLACGTGAVASAVALGLLGETRPPVNVETRSGEVLRVYYEISGKNASNVYLEGGAEIVFKGRV